MPEQTVRADARRNRARILAAARQAFTTDGLDAPTTAIARRAQVGTATLYRHFPSRHDLVDAVFRDEIQHCQTILAAAVDTTDPWAGLRRALDAVIDLELAAPGLAHRIATSPRTSRLLGDFDRHVHRDLAHLAARLRTDGHGRADLTGADIMHLVTGVRAVAASSPTHAAAHARRFADLTLDGMRRAAQTDPTLNQNTTG